MEEVALIPGQKTIFVGQLERDIHIGVPNALEGKTISFWTDREMIGVAKTDDEGRAHLVADLASSTIPTSVIARVWVGLQRIEVTRPVHRWQPNRVIIAVDIDHTIAETDYEGVLIDDVDHKSKPIPGSIETLKILEKNFHLMYVTARPNFLLDESENWLGLHGYPSAPLVMGANASALVNQAELKGNLLNMRRAQLPHLLIGIGDKGSDAEAYSAANMLSIILAPLEESPEAANVLVMQDWSDINRFFNANMTVLNDAERLTDLLSRQAISEFAIPKESKQRIVEPSEKDSGDDEDDATKDNADGD